MATATTPSAPTDAARMRNLRIWNAVRPWVSEYLGLYYNGSDAAVNQDPELQAWARQSKKSRLSFYDYVRLDAHLSKRVTK